MVARSRMVQLAVGALLVGLGAIDAHAGVRLKKDLAPTVANPGAIGQAAVVVSGKGARRKGKFKIAARHLAAGTTYSVRVAGVTIGTLTANGRGNGRARFSTVPGRADQPLGVDPRGEHVTVADDEGEDELEGDMPDDSPNACCCHDDEGEQEGDELDDATCQDVGGTAPGAPSCIPDPCHDDGEETACCVAHEDGAECELESTAECASHHGVSLAATSCEPDPCGTVTPPTVTRCCLADESDDGEGDHGGAQDCEHLTADHCAAHGGHDIGSGSCEPNPCGGGSPSGAFLD